MPSTIYIAPHDDRCRHSLDLERPPVSFATVYRHAVTTAVWCQEDQGLTPDAWDAVHLLEHATPDHLATLSGHDLKALFFCGSPAAHLAALHALQFVQIPIMNSDALRRPDVYALISAWRNQCLAPQPFAMCIRMDIAAGMWQDRTGLLETEEWSVVLALTEASPEQLEALHSADLQPLLTSTSAEAREAALHALAHVSHSG